MTGPLDAHEATATQMVRLHGLATALYELAAESPLLQCTSPHANAILSLIVTIEAEAERTSSLHEAEWHAAQNMEDAA
ncbi:hypothetical protein [Paracoccus sp. SM22M-07]|uniref:hypothetical protein n=1 Tax=Paracoccus sp. SM22M-07 TaxID=1520813 RepID=UPI0009180BD2|nr:hypothetical protein [Paracoccus sp. SM22M-07]OJH45829.1 hypothetical protein IE00_00865 [Paracoccus sp. SM22M-07]